MVPIENEAYNKTRWTKLTTKHLLSFRMSNILTRNTSSRACRQKCGISGNQRNNAATSLQDWIWKYIVVSKVGTITVLAIYAKKSTKCVLTERNACIQIQSHLAGNCLENISGKYMSNCVDNQTENYNSGLFLDSFYPNKFYHKKLNILYQCIMSKQYIYL